VDHAQEHDRVGSFGCNRAERAGPRSYKAAARLARKYAPVAPTVLDVGPCRPPIQDLLGWVVSATVVDLAEPFPASGPGDRDEDVLRLLPAGRFGLVFCLHALDQVSHPGRLLQKLLTLGEEVIVSLACPEVDGRPPAEVRLQLWAGRRWLESEVLPDVEGMRRVAIFRGGELEAAGAAGDFGLADDERTWLDDLAVRIEAVRLPRRRPRFAATVPAPVFQDDPLRREVTGTVGVYIVRALWHALTFDEHRRLSWRLEHKLVQARIFDRYLGGEFPDSWGVRALVRRGLGDRLLDGLFSRRLFAKEALGHLSGDYGEAEATHDVLRWLLDCRQPLPPRTPLEEEWLVQERIPIEREYRVHSLEDQVLPEMTFPRYGPCPVPPDRDEVNAYVASILARLPDALVGESLYAWDIARQPDGRFRVIEVNLAGFHPVFERGFQVSGFFQYHPHGPPLLTSLARRIEATYNVALKLSGDWVGEPNRHALYLRLFRHYWERPPGTPITVRVSPAPPPERLEAVLSLRAVELERFTLLRDSIRAVGTPIGRLWLAVPDAEVAAVVASKACAGPGCVVVPESELVPEAGEYPNAPGGVRRQVARLALVARTGGDFCLSLSPEVVCVRRFDLADLLHNGKAYYSRTITNEHSERYAQAEALLGLRRTGWVHGTLPYLISTRAAAELTDYLDRRAGGLLDVRGSWRRFLLGRSGWELSQVYFTFLEAFRLEERDYFPGDWDLAGNGVWASEDWDEWEAAASFDEYASFYFSVIRPGPVVPAAAVRRRLAPHLGLTSPGGAQWSED
jgi:hypothetical protein